VQSVLQLFPLQVTRPAHDPGPLQVMRFVEALLDTVEAHDEAPVHSVSQLSPPQVTGPWQAAMPEQVTVLEPPTAVTPALQAFVPLQLTLHVDPPQSIRAVHAPSAHRTSHEVAARQSMVWLQPPGGQSMEHGIPVGQTIGPVQGEHAEPQANVQTPDTHAPPAI
jgi:hypothetical protein